MQLILGHLARSIVESLINLNPIGIISGFYFIFHIPIAVVNRVVDGFSIAYVRECICLCKLIFRIE
ncbi:hypothetical protein WM00_34015 [Burkholderia cepacia]|nr:hypothetical protein WM00_34015 [Burkholderia cepacia]